MKTYTMILTSGLHEPYECHFFATCKRIAKTIYGEYEVTNNLTGKKCIIISNSSTFTVCKWG